MLRPQKAVALLGSGLILVALVAYLAFDVGDGPAPPRPPAPVETKQVAPNRWIVSRLEKDAYLSDIQRVTSQITLKPNPGKEQDSVTDLSIAKVEKGSPMDLAGLRREDRILKVNGTPIGTMGRAVNLVHEIKLCHQLTLQVQRGDLVIDYQFDFE